ncbi:DUF2971 domain-containing protein [Lactonifactor longoviformis]|uniref:DUF2971 domain-containing protein n=2 Tax=Lactonifactor TaxID=420345 RepID=A0A1M4V3T8_9CLOT|nr:DUF2971 domain-containing protein [Lactonifactor longoviformis]SHE63543.1 Protein of unknown function [Lactonifactor longoviformis DSM 17459]
MEGKAMRNQIIHLKTIERNTTLYHYTQIAGVQGILDEKSFWATKSDFLNDPREFSYIIEVIQQMSGSVFKNKEWKELFLKNIFKEGDHFVYEKNKEFFVLAFSTCSDSITLWAEFGNETGYNMAFDSEKIIKKIAKSNAIAYHGYVVYALEEQRDYILDLMQKKIPESFGLSFADIMNRGMTSESDPVFQKACRMFQKAAKIYAMFFKQEGFTEEREYRFVFKKSEGMNVLFREKEGFLIPYIKITMLESDNKLPIRGITVAPKNDSDLARKGMEYYLHRHGYQVPVELSRIKLRY